MDWWLDVDEPYKRKHTLSTCRDEPFRATLLHSPGWNEGKARYETLGTYKTKNYMSSFRSGTFSAHVWFVLRSEECRSYGAQRTQGERLTQGLRPGL